MTHQNETPTVTIDVMEFEHLLDTSDATDAEKREYLESIWQIICEFVQLGFGVHPIQQLVDDSKKAQNSGALLTQGMLESAHHRKEKPMLRAPNTPAAQEEGVTS